eukprot:s307_g5.t2
MTALFLTVEWTNLTELTHQFQGGFEIGTFFDLVSSQWFRGTTAHQGLIVSAAAIAAQCGLYRHYTLPTCKFRERIKVGEPRDFYFGFLGSLLNLRKVDKQKANVEPNLPGITFAASEEQLGEKVRRLKSHCASTDIGLCFVVCLMLDIARYSNQSGIALGCAAIPINTVLGISGATAYVTSMSRAFGTLSLQYSTCRRILTWGKHGEEEGTFTDLCWEAAAGERRELQRRAQQRRLLRQVAQKTKARLPDYSRALDIRRLRRHVRELFGDEP